MMYLSSAATMARGVRSFIGWIVRREGDLFLPAFGLFDLIDFFDSGFVSAAFERSPEVDFHDPAHQGFANKVGGQAEDVGVVMPSGHFSGQLVVAQSGTNAV